MSKAVLLSFAMLLMGCAVKGERGTARAQPLPVTQADPSGEEQVRVGPATSGPLGEGQEVVEGFRLDAAVVRPAFLSGEPIPVRFTLTNVGTGAAMVAYVRPPLAQYQLRMERGDGRSVERTPWEREAMNPSKFSGSSGTLAPGEATEWTVQLEDLFELRQPGEYRVRGERGVHRRSDPPEPVWVPSNWATFWVFERRGESK